MNKLFLLLLFAFSLGAVGRTTAQDRPKGNLKRAFSHNSESSKGKNNKAHFRHESTRPIIDLNPHSPEKFKTSRASHHYKFAKGH